MNKYHEGKIYKIVNCVDDKVYVGSTCRSLYDRLQKHKEKSKKNDYKVYRHFDDIGWNNVKIELVENFKCDNKTELRIREQYWIEELNPELNTIRAYLSKEDKKAYNDKYSKQYRKENPEKIKKYLLENNEKITKQKNEKFVCECGGKYSCSGKARHFKSKKHQKHLSTIQ